MDLTTPQGVFALIGAIAASCVLGLLVLWVLRRLFTIEARRVPVPQDIDLAPQDWRSRDRRVKRREPFFGPGWPQALAYVVGIGIMATVVHYFTTPASNDRSPTYTLYRNSPLDQTMRVHWATFDADDRSTFNQGNCELAANVLNKNLPPGMKQRWWCEKGRFNP